MCMPPPPAAFCSRPRWLPPHLVAQGDGLTAACPTGWEAYTCVKMVNWCRGQGGAGQGDRMQSQDW